MPDVRSLPIRDATSIAPPSGGWRKHRGRSSAVCRDVLSRLVCLVLALALWTTCLWSHIGYLNRPEEEEATRVHEELMHMWRALVSYQQALDEYGRTLDKLHVLKMKRASALAQRKADADADADAQRYVVQRLLEINQKGQEALEDKYPAPSKEDNPSNDDDYY